MNSIKRFICILLLTVAPLSFLSCAKVTVSVGDNDIVFDGDELVEDVGGIFDDLSGKFDENDGSPSEEIRAVYDILI